MVDIDAADICKAMPHLRESHVEPRWALILHQLRKRGLGDRDMQRMAVATIAAETAGFVPISEGKSRYNSAPNAIPFGLYDFRADLGNGAVGDGARYKGRGYVQLTGKDNYARIGRRLGIDLVGDPEQANDECIAAAILAEYLLSRVGEIRAAIKRQDLRAARRAVNGGSHGLDRFRDCWVRLG
jgi:putative chitinase